MVSCNQSSFPRGSCRSVGYVERPASATRAWPPCSEVAGRRSSCSQISGLSWLACLLLALILLSGPGLARSLGDLTAHKLNLSENETTSKSPSARTRSASTTGARTAAVTTDIPTVTDVPAVTVTPDNKHRHGYIGYIGVGMRSMSAAVLWVMFLVLLYLVYSSFCTCGPRTQVIPVVVVAEVAEAELPSELQWKSAKEAETSAYPTHGQPPAAQPAFLAADARNSTARPEVVVAGGDDDVLMSYEEAVARSRKNQ